MRCQGNWETREKFIVQKRTEARRKIDFLYVRPKLKVWTLTDIKRDSYFFLGKNQHKLLLSLSLPFSLSYKWEANTKHIEKFAQNNIVSSDSLSIGILFFFFLKFLFLFFFFLFYF